MSNAPAAAGEVRQAIQRAADNVSPFLEHLARLGFAAKGIVYITMGFLAALAPVGMSNGPTGTRGALATLFRQPTGTIILATIAAGMFCFGLWQLVRAVEDPEYEGTSWKAIGKRIAWGFNALAHFAFTFIALGLLIGYRHAAASDDQNVRDWTATALSYPFGRWVVAGIAVGIIFNGLLHVARGIRGKLDKHLVIQGVSPSANKWLCGIARFGISFRGLVFTIIGIFLIMAAYHHNAGEARGLGGALRSVAAQPYGRWLLAITALGLISYGLYDFILARFRRIRV